MQAHSVRIYIKIKKFQNETVELSALWFSMWNPCEPQLHQNTKRVMTFILTENGTSVSNLLTIRNQVGVCFWQIQNENCWSILRMVANFQLPIINERILNPWSKVWIPQHGGSHWILWQQFPQGTLVLTGERHGDNDLSIFAAHLKLWLHLD
jgi:hypothetical protein